MDRDDFEVVVVVKADLVGGQPRLACLAEGCLVVGQFVDVDGAVVDASHAGEILVRWREGEGGDLDLVILPAFEEHVVLEVPEVDLGFEAHLALLAGCDLAAGLADREGGESFVGTVEETD